MTIAVRAGRGWCGVIWSDTENDWQLVLVGLAALGGLIAFTTALVRTGQWIGAVNSDRKTFKIFMEKIEAKLDKIFERLLPPQTVKSASPVTLTEFGKAISQNLRAARWAADQAPQLMDEAQGKKEFEIFELCVEYVELQIESHEQLATSMRSGAYRHGIDFEQIRKVYEVELRDALLRLMERPA